MKKSKFIPGQVVMVVKRSFDGADRYPVKLDHITSIGTREGIAWMDTLSNVEYESDMRPLTDKETGKQAGAKSAEK